MIAAKCLSLQEGDYFHCFDEKRSSKLRSEDRSQGESTFCFGFMDERRVAMVACASADSLGGASSTTPAHLPTIAVTSCSSDHLLS